MVGNLSPDVRLHWIWKNLAGWVFNSLVTSIGAFAIAAFVIAIAGTKITKIADRLADKTGLGEAVVGAVFLGGNTSLPGLVTSVTAAASANTPSESIILSDLPMMPTI